MFKICVVGCGNMSNLAHGPSCAQYAASYPDVELSACCDLDAQRAQTYMHKYGFQAYYTDYEKMLAEIQPDAVCLMAPVWKTCEMAIKIMEMGFHVIMEKPPGKNVDEINQMIAAAKKANVNVRCAFNRRFMPLVMELKKRLAEGAEEIYNITYHLYRKDRYNEDFSTTAIHAVDTTKYIMGSDYKTIRFSYQHLPKQGELCKNIYMDCEFENGARAHIDMITFGGASFERVSVNTFNHTYYLDLPILDVTPGRLSCYENNSIWQQIDGKTYYEEHKSQEHIDGADVVEKDARIESSGFYNENRLFFEHIRHSDEVICELPSAIQSVEIEDCIRHNLPFYSKES